MNKEKTFLTSSTIELSEDEENSQFLTLVNRICYYDEPNLNSVLLPSDTAEECAQSLIDMPVYAKCRTNALTVNSLLRNRLHTSTRTTRLPPL